MDVTGECPAAWVADLDAVDHDDGDIEVCELSIEPRIQLILRQLHEAPTRSAFAGAMSAELRRQFFERTIVVARRHSEHHLLHRSLGQRIFLCELLPRRQRDSSLFCRTL
jgi:hypothetical protein